MGNFGEGLGCVTIFMFWTRDDNNSGRASVHGLEFHSGDSLPLKRHDQESVSQPRTSVVYVLITIRIMSSREFIPLCLCLSLCLSLSLSFSISLSEVRVEGEDFRGNSFQAKSGGRCFL